MIDKLSWGLIKKSVALIKAEPFVLGPSILYISIVMIGLDWLPVENISSYLVLFPILQWVIESFILGLCLVISHQYIREQCIDIHKGFVWTISNWLRLMVSLGPVYLFKGFLLMQIPLSIHDQFDQWERLSVTMILYLLVSLVFIFSPSAVLVRSESGLRSLISSLRVVFNHKKIVSSSIFYLFAFKVFILFVLVPVGTIPGFGLSILSFAETILSVISHIFVLYLFLDLISKPNQVDVKIKTPG